MKKLFIVANWKSNKSLIEAKEWFEKFSAEVLSPDKSIIIAPPFSLLSAAKIFSMEKRIPLTLSAQNVSAYPLGSYTGEIAAVQVKEFAEYVIIGHSERRNYFKEDTEVLEKKVGMAHTAGLNVIFCVQDANTPIPEGVTIVAYEPISAIGSGNPDSPENANAVAQSIKQRGILYVLYGGSVTAENVSSYTSQEGLDGVLVGKASLQPEEFTTIVQNS